MAKYQYNGCTTELFYYTFQLLVMGIQEDVPKIN